MPNLSDNLEDLLIYDDVFYDYFNSFLSLPVWLSFQIRLKIITFEITQ